jgi:hypothetical protein
MKKLKLLNANNNYLENIPMGVYSQPRIQSIRLNTNQIRYISSDIANLKQLRTLDIGNNMLVSVPKVLQHLERLDFFNVRGNNIQEKITLHNGEITAPVDFYKKRRMFEAKRQNTDTTKRYRSNKGQMSRSRSKPHDNSTVSKNSTFQTNQNNPNKMWDSEDLLQNGYTKRHLESNLSSAYLNYKIPVIGETLRSYHDKSFTNTSIKSYSRIPAHEAALMMDDDDDSVDQVPVTTTDYQLLGVCNQVEMLLNKQLLHPVLSLRGHNMGKR